MLFAVISRRKFFKGYRDDPNLKRWLMTGGYFDKVRRSLTGQTWVTSAPLPGLDNANPRFCAGGVNGNAVLNTGSGRSFWTDDYGDTWTEATYVNSPFGSYNEIAYGDGRYVGTRDDGTSVSEDGGRTFTFYPFNFGYWSEAIAHGGPALKRRFIITGYNGTWWSTTGKGDWTYINGINYRGMWWNGELWMAHRESAYISTDGGDTLVPSGQLYNTTAPATGLSYICVPCGGPGWWVVGSPGGGTYRSTDNGRNWTRVDPIGQIMYYAYSHGDTAFVGLGGGGGGGSERVSFDKGLTWQNTNTSCLGATYMGASQFNYYSYGDENTRHAYTHDGIAGQKTYWKVLPADDGNDYSANSVDYSSWTNGISEGWDTIVNGANTLLTYSGGMKLWVKHKINLLSTSELRLYFQVDDRIEVWFNGVLRMVTQGSGYYDANPAWLVLGSNQITIRAYDTAYSRFYLYFYWSQPTDGWRHVEVSYDAARNGVIRINGVTRATGTGSKALNAGTGPGYIGRYTVPDGGGMTARIDNFRVTRAIRHTADFIPNITEFGPANDPLWASVTSALEFEGANGSSTFNDLTGRAWTANGAQATIDTSQHIAGASCGNFVYGSYLSTPHDASLELTAPFTIDFWIKQDAYSGGNPCQFGQVAGSDAGIGVTLQADGRVSFYIWSNDYATDPTTVLGITSDGP